MSRILKVWFFLSGGVLTLFLLGWLLCLLGFRFNFTSSIPPGLYFTQSVAAPIQRGQIASLCPPDTVYFRHMREKRSIYAGNCPGNYLHWLKPVIAVPGDVVRVTEQGVSVNGRLLANTRPLLKTPSGEQLPRLRGEFPVQQETVWVVSSFNPLSLDSRYFGAIPIRQIDRTAIPVFRI